MRRFIAIESGAIGFETVGDAERWIEMDAIRCGHRVPGYRVAEIIVDEQMLEEIEAMSEIYYREAFEKGVAAERARIIDNLIRT